MSVDVPSKDKTGYRYGWLRFTISIAASPSFMKKWLSLRRINLALKQFRASPEAKDVIFTVKYFPYQLYPEASKEGEDKYEW